MHISPNVEDRNHVCGTRLRSKLLGHLLMFHSPMESLNELGLKYIG